MRLLVATLIVLGATAAVSGCGGGAGPARRTFNPFGIDPASGGNEPAGAASETPPGVAGAQQTVEQLCASACIEIAAKCPGAAGTSCSSGCVVEVGTNPTCAPEYQQFLVCVTSTPISCSTDGMSIEAPACNSIAQLVASCLGGGPTASGA